MLGMKGEGITHEIENFSFPLFQTFGMFLGMTFGLVIHAIILYFRIPFPGYVHPQKQGYQTIGDSSEPEAQPLPYWMYFLLIIPSVFDLVATGLCMTGLLYVDVSIYQMLRGMFVPFTFSLDIV